MPGPMLETRELSCGRQGAKVLDSVGIKLQPGSVAGLLGPNGSGKTTLLLTLAGALPPFSGSIRIQGEELSGLKAKARARLAASVPQKAGNGFSLLCYSVALMGRYPYLSFFGSYSAADQAKAIEAMRSTGCADLAERRIDQVSGGEFQRVLVARALCQEAGLLLLDEPTASLDIAGAVHILDLIKARAGSGGGAVMALHDLNLAGLYCDQLIFLKNGRAAAAGRTKEVFNAKTLSEVYETEIMVTSHPVTGAPQAHFVPGRALPDPGPAD